MIAPARRAPGVGFDSAAEFLIGVGDNAHRIHSDAVFTNLCDVAPVPTGSGKTIVRHRLNCGGARQVNAWLYRIMKSDLIYRHVWPTSKEARKAVGEYIEVF